VSERAKATPAGDSIAALNDHLGRMLHHADRLLAEWQEHADAMRARFEAEARDAGDVLRKSIEAAMAEAGTPARVSQHVARAKDAADRLGGPSMLGAPPDVQEQLGKLARDLTSLRQEVSRAGAPKEPGRERLLVPLAVVANILLIVLLAIVWVRKPAPATAQPPEDPTDRRPGAGPSVPAGAHADAGLAAAPVPPDSPEARLKTPCAALALSGPDAERSLNECLDHICGFPDKGKASLPENCHVEQPAGKKAKKKVTLVCTFGTAPAVRTLWVDWPGECPAPQPAPAPAPPTQ
jgi:hypothetical protein